MSRVCSYCACSGHNKATCEVRLMACILIPPQETTFRSCSYCGCTGHDRRNCLAHQQLMNFFPEQENVFTPAGKDTPPPRAPSTLGTAAAAPSGRNIDLSSIKRSITFSTPLKLSDAGLKRPSRVARPLPPTHRARQVTQVIDYDIYDEPWVWAPIGKPTTSVVQPTPHNIIFT